MESIIINHRALVEGTDLGKTCSIGRPAETILCYSGNTWVGEVNMGRCSRLGLRFPSIVLAQMPQKYGLLGSERSEDGLRAITCAQSPPRHWPAMSFSSRCEDRTIEVAWNTFPCCWHRPSLLLPPTSGHGVKGLRPTKCTQQPATLRTWDCRARSIDTVFVEVTPYDCCVFWCSVQPALDLPAAAYRTETETALLRA